MMLCQVAIVAFEYTHGNLPAIKVDTSLLKVGQGGLSVATILVDDIVMYGSGLGQ